MSGPARYYIAQHVPDLFRREAENIGVIVVRDGQAAARFLGEKESEPGAVDGRRIRWVRYPDAYQQWISHWRRLVDRGRLDALEGATGQHYKLVPAGEVRQTEGDPLPEVVEYLYARLVSHGGLQDVAGRAEEASADNRRLTAQVAESFERLSLLEGSELELFCRHPVKRQAIVEGAKQRYRPSFIQQNGRLWVMEPVDLTQHSKVGVRDHAGWTAYMFADIRQAHRGTETISLVRFAPDLEDEQLHHAFELIRKESEVIDWGDEDARNEFLRTREEIARSQ